MEYLNDIQDKNKDERYNEYIKYLSESFLLGNNLLSKESSTSNFVDYLEEFKEKGKTDYLADINDVISDLPKSNGSRVFKKLNYKIGMVADEFLYNSYKDIANVIYIPSDITKDRKSTRLNSSHVSISYA